jgi:hypothetical protein
MVKVGGGEAAQSPFAMVRPRQTLASYVSMHTVPDTTESDGHLLSGFAPCASAGVGRNAAPMVIPTNVDA